MKKIKIKPEDLIFTRWSEFESFSSLEKVPTATYWKKVSPIIVLKHPQKKAYLIYNGNHRALIAKKKKLKVKALLVESEEDLSKIPPEESIYESSPEHYQNYDTAIKRLIQKSEIFYKKQKSKPKDNMKARLQTKVIPLVKDNVNLLKESGCKKLLELNFRTGTNLVYLSEKGFRVYGIDTSDEMLHIAKNTIKQNHLKGTQVKKGNMRNIPFKDNEFDAVIASNGIFNQTIEQIKKAIKETHRVLKKDGLFFFNVLTKEFPDYGKGILVEKDTFIDSDNSNGSIPKHYFSKEEIKKELTPLFKILKIYPEYSYQGQTKTVPMEWNIIAKKEGP